MLALALPGCRRGNGGAGDSQAAAQLNVVLIVMDSTRADRLGCYGGTDGITPHIDALAARGARFAQAYAQAPWTLPSLASLLTSTHPIVHQAGGRIGKFNSLSGGVETLAEAFKGSGYRTGAVINVMFLSETFGLTRGFEEVDYFDSTNTVTRNAAQTTDAALRWIATVRAQPFFALVHYFDPHLTYDPPEEFRRRFADPASAEHARFGTIEEMMLLRGGKVSLDAKQINVLEKLYDGEVAYMDREIGRLLAMIEKLGLEKRTIVALVADHGEEFNDHGGFEHGHTLYNELLHVPLILAGGDIPPGRVVSDVVGLTDVAPTLCAIAGVATPARFAGWSLLSTMEGLPLERRALLSRGNMWGPELDALRRGPFKLIRVQDKRMLFNVEADPQELHDVLNQEPAVVAELEQELAVLTESLQAQSTGGSSEVTLTADQRRRLCALGYIDCSN